MTPMLISVDCPRCNGNGEVCGVNSRRRSRFVGYDDLSPDDYTVPCPNCAGTGVVDQDLNEEIEP